MEVKKIQRKFKKLFKFPKSQKNETFEQLLNSIESTQVSDSQSSLDGIITSKKRRGSKNSHKTTDKSSKNSSRNSSDTEESTFSESSRRRPSTMNKHNDSNLVFNVSHKNRLYRSNVQKANPPSLKFNRLMGN